VGLTESLTDFTVNFLTPSIVCLEKLDIGSTSYIHNKPLEIVTNMIVQYNLEGFEQAQVIRASAWFVSFKVL
jgi:hypothetical protein